VIGDSTAFPEENHAVPDRSARPGGPRPRLLFIAHREELFQQSLLAFRADLRDPNFGDLLVSGRRPESDEHLFVSIQSYNSKRLAEQFAPDHFAYVVVDEFHHAAAPSYERLLAHLCPRVLLGLTATPERSDSLDILGHFGGHMSAQIRLPDAINRKLLCPFQYFGVTDAVDLRGLQWQRGGYRTEDLNHLYTGNDQRAGLVLDRVRQILLDPLRARGLGFCVSVAHAASMAAKFNQHGIPADCLSGESDRGHRAEVQGRLRRREINFLFVVDLYNEGVDIPEVDTVLFLRPTESLTVFLQQLGRGLRLDDGKDCLPALEQCAPPCAVRDLETIACDTVSLKALIAIDRPGFCAIIAGKDLWPLLLGSQGWLRPLYSTGLPTVRQPWTRSRVRTAPLGGAGRGGATRRSRSTRLTRCFFLHSSRGFAAICTPNRLTTWSPPFARRRITARCEPNSCSSAGWTEATQTRAILRLTSTGSASIFGRQRQRPTHAARSAGFPSKT
jgi:hypothetical protein